MFNKGFAGALLAITVGLSQAATIETTDFITSPDHFSGFEDLPYLTYDLSHLEDQILVTQVGGLDGIWGGYTSWGAEGSRAWYTNGGDYGYTDIKLANSADIGNISFLAGDGWALTGVTFVHYQLLEGGVVIQSGTVATATGSWLGFSQGGFDEVRLAATTEEEFVWGADYQALAIDSIKISASTVPEPETYGLMLAGLCAIGFAARRSKQV